MSRRSLLTQREALARAARREVMGASMWSESPVRPNVAFVYGGTDAEPEENLTPPTPDPTGVWVHAPRPRAWAFINSQGDAWPMDAMFDNTLLAGLVDPMEMVGDYAHTRILIQISSWESGQRPPDPVAGIQAVSFNPGVNPTTVTHFRVVTPTGEVSTTFTRTTWSKTVATGIWRIWTWVPTGLTVPDRAAASGVWTFEMDATDSAGNPVLSVRESRLITLLPWLPTRTASLPSFTVDMDVFTNGLGTPWHTFNTWVPQNRWGYVYWRDVDAAPTVVSRAEGHTFDMVPSSGYQIASAAFMLWMADLPQYGMTGIHLTPANYAIRTHQYASSIFPSAPQFVIDRPQAVAAIKTAMAARFPGESLVSGAGMDSWTGAEISNGAITYSFLSPPGLVALRRTP